MRGHNFWLVAKHEYAKIVKTKSFLLGTLGVPALIVVVTAVSVIVALGQRGVLPVGYVDHAGILDATVLPPREEGEELVALRAFSDEALAQAALEAEEIQAFYVLSKDYVQTGQMKLVYGQKRPSEVAREDFVAFLRANLLAQQSPAIQKRVQEGPWVTIRSADGSREFDSENILSFVVPYAAAFFFFFAVMNSGGYMLQAITDEKENRTVEILATSLRPLELIGGKALGLMSVGLTQLAIWTATGLLALVVATSMFPDLLNGFNIPWSFIGVTMLFFLPAYALMAGMMTAVGSAVTDHRQGQQISGIFNLLFTFPFFFIVLIMAKPNSPLVVALTLFPTTAFITITLRWAMAIVPLWQLLVSWVLVVSTAVFSVWVAARIFRIGMLRYGQRLSFKHILTSLQGKE